MYGANLQRRADSTRGATGGGHGRSALLSGRCFIDWAQGLTDTLVWSSASAHPRSSPAAVSWVCLQSNMDERICLETSKYSIYIGVLIFHAIGGDQEERTVNYQLRSSWLFFWYATLSFEEHFLLRQWRRTDSRGGWRHPGTDVTYQNWPLSNDLIKECINNSKSM